MNGKSNALEFIRTIAVLRHCWWVPLLDAFLPSVFLIPTVNPLCGSPTNQPTHQRAFPLSFTHSLQLPVRLAIWDPSQIFPEYWHETTIFKTLEMYGLGNPFISNSIHISRSATLLSSRYNSFSFAHRIWVPGPLPIISAWLLEWLIRAVWGQDIKTRIVRFAISAIHPQLFAFFDISPSLSVLVSLPFLDNMSHLQQFRIPDLHADVPLKDSTNPHYRAAAAESRAWINSFHIFKNRKRVDFIQGLNELLCSHVYCFAGYEQFRTTCDFVSLGASWLLDCTMVFSLLFWSPNFRSMCCLLWTRSATTRMARMPAILASVSLKPWGTLSLMTIPSLPRLQESEFIFDSFAL